MTIKFQNLWIFLFYFDHRVGRAQNELTTDFIKFQEGSKNFTTFFMDDPIATKAAAPLLPLLGFDHLLVTILTTNLSQIIYNFV